MDRLDDDNICRTINSEVSKYAKSIRVEIDEITKPLADRRRELEAENVELKRKLEAAKEDMIRIAMHDYTVSKCRACKYDGEDGYGCDLNPAEFDDSECHFMWRGVQEENNNEI